MQLAFAEQYVVEEKRSATRLIKTVYRVKVGVKHQQRWCDRQTPGGLQQTEEAKKFRRKLLKRPLALRCPRSTFSRMGSQMSLPGSLFDVLLRRFSLFHSVPSSGFTSIASYSPNLRLFSLPFRGRFWIVFAQWSQWWLLFCLLAAPRFDIYSTALSAFWHIPNSSQRFNFFCSRPMHHHD